MSRGPRLKLSPTQKEALTLLAESPKGSADLGSKLFSRGTVAVLARWGLIAKTLTARTRGTRRYMVVVQITDAGRAALSTER